MEIISSNLFIVKCCFFILILHFLLVSYPRLTCRLVDSCKLDPDGLYLTNFLVRFPILFLLPTFIQCRFIQLSYCLFQDDTFYCYDSFSLFFLLLFLAAFIQCQFSYCLFQDTFSILFR